MQRFTIAEFQRKFPDDAACLEWLKHYLYPSGIECQVCRRVTKHHRVASRPSYSCDVCGHHVHPTAGTIYHKSTTPLRSWFYATFLMAQTRTGISAKQLERELGVTYKTAWRIFTQIRKLMAEDVEPLGGQVEADETYVGGKDRNRHVSKRSGSRGRGDTGKTIVAGIVQRKGHIVAKVAPNVSADTLLPNIMAHVMPASTVFTDELSGYNGLGAAGYNHERVHHAAKVYVSGTAHTNTIEGFWSLSKRGIDGVHHVVGAEYLQSYMNEYAWRWNHRDDARPMFLTLLGQVQKV